MAAIATAPPIHYPSSDGKPMAETGIHVNAIMLLHQALQDFFADRPDVYIASDMFWYWKEGDIRKRLAPDVMAIPGVGNYERRSFRTFDEGGAIPAVVFEMASENTWKVDEGPKFKKYEKLGVKEYFIFDPEWLYLSSQLKGYRLSGPSYQRLEPIDGRLTSQLGFQLAPEGTMLRLFWSESGEPIPTREEGLKSARRLVEVEQRQAEEQRKQAEEQRRRADDMEREVARLKAILATKSTAHGSEP